MSLRPCLTMIYTVCTLSSSTIYYPAAHSDHRYTVHLHFALTAPARCVLRFSFPFFSFSANSNFLALLWFSSALLSAPLSSAFLGLRYCCLRILLSLPHCVLLILSLRYLLSAIPFSCFPRSSLPVSSSCS